ncbi:uncharacterized protein SCHCODRAFT_02499351 [Schizophyllum commune H4-8]|uniref:uncharacterized protein n=1 Tax=Schizophyllum commune (strain H4-8 / FGSC 9210) TaxID=578458 RepID=UPI00215EF013|nr:uncharacterized protein SCHCODRAFT_02499351 [Schizophyllum commune H4-8]KAI5893001.1 hypothetical protein SCHCODRAFT_02499351 [Schizophyllum commune H4-8]
MASLSISLNLPVATWEALLNASWQASCADSAAELVRAVRAERDSIAVSLRRHRSTSMASLHGRPRARSLSSALPNNTDLGPFHPRPQAGSPSPAAEQWAPRPTSPGVNHAEDWPKLLSEASFSDDTASVCTAEPEQFYVRFSPASYSLVKLTLEQSTSSARPETHLYDVCNPVEELSMIRNSGCDSRLSAPSSSGPPSPLTEYSDDEDSPTRNRCIQSPRRTRLRSRGRADRDERDSAREDSSPSPAPRNRKRRRRSKEKQARRHVRPRTNSVRLEGDKQHKNWTLVDGPVPLTEGASLLVEQVCGQNDAQRVSRIAALFGVVDNLSNAAVLAAPSSPLNLASIAAMVTRLERSASEMELALCMGYIQLVLNVDHLDREARQTRQKNGSRDARRKQRARAAQGALPHGANRAELARSAGVSKSTLERWLGMGTRLLYLCMAGTPLILFALSSCAFLGECRSGRYTTYHDIMAMGLPFREPDEQTAAGRLVRNHYLPLLRWMQQEATGKSNLRLYDPSTAAYHHLSDFDFWDARFGEVQLNCFRLPPRSYKWEDYTSLAPQQPSACPLPAALTINTGRPFPSEPCPVTGDNRRAWTEAQRKKVDKCAVRVETKEELKRKLREGGDDYIVLDPGILDGMPLDLRAGTGDRIAFVVPIEGSQPGRPDLRELLDSVVDRIQCLLPSDFDTVDSSAEEYKGFVAIHFTIYCKYSEHGNENLPPPEAAHPTRISREGGTRVNVNMRVPRQSHEIREDPLGYQAIATMLKPLFAWVSENVMQTHLGPVQDELELFLEVLPLREGSPCAPFAGFVLNLGVATDGHRDRGDLRICMVSPLGGWTGGELVLHEARLVLALRAGDLLFFPSNRLTHFNMNCQGQRLSVVAHTDRACNAWVTDGFGWGAHLS